jgi:hypothetical protein
MFRCLAVRTALIAALTAYNTSLGAIAVVDFESLPVGPPGFGRSAGDSVGQIIPSLGQDGVQVSVEVFYGPGSFTDWFLAEVHGAGTDFFATKHMYLNNISLGFDLTGVGFSVNQLTIDYREGGGVDNFSVNGGAIIELPALTSLPVNIAPGVTATADSDSITLSGPVSRFLIGGQELAIDNIIATPEPTCLALLGVGGLALLRRVRRSRP